MQLLKHPIHKKYKLSSILYNQLKHNPALNVTNTNNKAHYTNIQARTGKGPNGHGPNGLMLYKLPPLIFIITIV
jgi:hypothetical protein